MPVDDLGQHAGHRFLVSDVYLPDHRNLSEVSIWTASARGFRPVCLSGMPVSVWWCAFCAMKCATRRADQKGPVAVLEAAGFEVVEDQEAIDRLLVFDPTVS